MSASLPVDVASFIAKLEQAYPEYRVAAALLARRAPALLAFEAIVHELVQTAFHLPEISVATGKLDWWRDELARWAAGQARHPLTRLIAPPSTDPPSIDGVDALIAIAVGGRELPPPRDFTAQCAALLPAFAGIERLRVDLLGAPAATSAVRAELGVISHLIRELARLPVAEDSSGTAAVPMHLLARHRASRTELTRPGATREAIVRAQLDDLATALDTMRPAFDATATGFARVRWRCERWRVVAAGAGDPFPRLWSRLDRAPWDTAWLAWRALRGEASPAPAKLLSPDR